MKMGGLSVINLVRTMEDDGDDETMNDTESVVNGELNIPKATADMVDDSII